MQLTKMLKKPPFLAILICINLIGSAYGFYWYRLQLLNTPGVLKIFVPDSPTASFLFSISLTFLIIKRKKPFIMLIACAWLIKYGIWAVIINTHFLLSGGNYDFTNFHLTLSHLCMALEGYIFIKDVHLKKIHIWTLTALMLLSDILDYGLGIHPRLFAESQLKTAVFSAVLLTAFICCYCFILFKRRAQISQ